MMADGHGKDVAATLGRNLVLPSRHWRKCGVVGYFHLF